MAREAQASHRALAMAAISMRIGERNSPLALTVHTQIRLLIFSGELLSQDSSAGAHCPQRSRRLSRDGSGHGSIAPGALERLGQAELARQALPALIDPSIDLREPDTQISTIEYSHRRVDDRSRRERSGSIRMTWPQCHAGPQSGWRRASAAPNPALRDDRSPAATVARRTPSMLARKS
jgi:hypothetical protein